MLSTTNTISQDVKINIQTEETDLPPQDKYQSSLKYLVFGIAVLLMIFFALSFVVEEGSRRRLCHIVLGAPVLPAILTSAGPGTSHIWKKMISTYVNTGITNVRQGHEKLERKLAMNDFLKHCNVAVRHDWDTVRLLSAKVSEPLVKVGHEKDESKHFDVYIFTTEHFAGTIVPKEIALVYADEEKVVLNMQVLNLETSRLVWRPVSKGLFKKKTFNVLSIVPDNDISRQVIIGYGAEDQKSKLYNVLHALKQRAEEHSLKVYKARQRIIDCVGLAKYNDIEESEKSEILTDMMRWNVWPTLSEEEKWFRRMILNEVEEHLNIEEMDSTKWELACQVSNHYQYNKIMMAYINQPEDSDKYVEATRRLADANEKVNECLKQLWDASQFVQGEDEDEDEDEQTETAATEI